MKPTRGYNSPGCHSTLATTWRDIPALRPIAEPGEEAAYFLRRSTDRTLKQVSDLALQDGVGRQPDRIAVALGFEELAERLARSPDTVKDYGQLARQSHPRLA
jgi:hypothetical protein